MKETQSKQIIKKTVFVTDDWGIDQSALEIEDLIKSSFDSIQVKGTFQFTR